MGNITVVGMGPGGFGWMTVEAWEAIQNAPTLILRTAIHPTAEEISRRGVVFSSYDERYEKAENFEALYASIADDLKKREKNGEEIVYATPGSPLVAERTVVLLRERAEAENVPLMILPGMSFVEPLCARLGVDPVEGLLIMDAGELDRLPMDWPTGLIVTQVYNAATASEAKLALMELLPDEYEVVVVQRVGLPDENGHRPSDERFRAAASARETVRLFAAYGRHAAAPRAGRLSLGPRTDAGEPEETYS